MKKWEFTYMWWWSVSKDTMTIEANSEEEAYKKFDDNFGYEDVDIIKCKQI